MPYVHRTVIAGQVIEHRKMHSSRIHTKGIERSKNMGHTTLAQEKVNERIAEEKLRWKLNANFGYLDLHAVLHYFDKERSLDQCRDDLALFFKRLRRICKAKGITLKYIAVTETKRMTNIHHHVVINRMDAEIIAEAWEGIEGTGGISFRLMDKRGNHAKLAAYLIKESKATMERYKEAGRSGKRYSSSQNLDSPVLRYETVQASTWRDEPKPHKGAVLYKFDDGKTARSGWHEVSGYPYQEYFEIFTPKRE